VDYYNQNNYDLKDRTAAKKIFQTVLNKFPILNNKKVDIYSIETRIRYIKIGQKPWVSSLFFVSL
jgi:cytochrome c